jgi:uncharacterized protein with HEPN domain
MPRDPGRRIDDIIACSENILRFTSGLNHDQLISQELVMDAVLRNMEVIGEAAKNVPEELRARIPGIEWKKIAGIRDWISHIDCKVDDDIVWDVVENKIPELLRTVQALKEELTREQISDP